MEKEQVSNSVSSGSSSDASINLIDLMIILAKRKNLIIGLPFAVAIFSGGKAPTMMDCPVESNPPPPMPCTNRQKTSIQRLVERPHIKEANVKITTDNVKYSFRPNKSDNILVSGMMITLEIA